ncbi:inheritance of peroxisomes protein 1-domain-containing protein [Apodospora peruviana]|uniref:Inheritance of peroxisomes protein 1 n=1 Tax=Apodospora peruviana TaxID=516989 RepID=A0AAE0LZS2_9PEZI|nr:inheritance of peroxisomes protein 1-domain-containing protein [Apodospora peruviana]
MEHSKPPGSAFPTPRRVFTAPIFSSSSAPPLASSSQSTDGAVETLYDHPSVKIVAFTAGPRQVSFSSRTALKDVEPGSLSWSSELERTIAVAFLNCGSALQPILPKSQVWCVDEASSKFILQIRRPQYWRIELPVTEPEDIQRTQVLRDVFDKILQFEKTECPFRRSFTVELPEPLPTPVTKRPWTPVRGPYPSLPSTPVTPVEIARLHRDTPTIAHLSRPVSKETLSDGVKGQDEVPSCPVSTADVHTESTVDDPPPATGSGGSEDDHEVRKDRAESPGDVMESRPLPKPRRLSNGFQTARTVTAPPELTLIASSPSKVREEGQPEPVREISRSESPADSQDSFHSVHSWDSRSLPPSPPISNPTSPIGLHCPPEIAEASVEQADDSVLTSIPNVSPTWSASPVSAPSDFGSSETAPSSVYDAEMSSTCSGTATEEVTRPASLIADEAPLEASVSSLSSSASSSSLSSSVPTRRSEIRNRATTSSSISPSRRRALSPLPSAANLFTPRQPSGSSADANRDTLAAVRRLPLAIIHTTCEILMSPPSHLLHLMLKVAARITAGEWRGFVFGTDERGERIPVQWDWSDDEDGKGPTFSRRPSWVPRTSEKMAGTFPESDDEESDRDENAMAEKPIGEEGISSRPPHEEQTTILEAAGIEPAPEAVESDNWSRSLGVD